VIEAEVRPGILVRMLQMVERQEFADSKVCIHICVCIYIVYVCVIIYIEYMYKSMCVFVFIICNE